MWSVVDSQHLSRHSSKLLRNSSKLLRNSSNSMVWSFLVTPQNSSEHQHPPRYTEHTGPLDLEDTIVRVLELEEHAPAHDYTEEWEAEQRAHLDL